MHISDIIQYDKDNELTHVKYKTKNGTPLGHCIQKVFTPGNFQNDLNHSYKIEFEKNNEELRKELEMPPGRSLMFYGSNVSQQNIDIEKDNGDIKENNENITNANRDIKEDTGDITNATANITNATENITNANENITNGKSSSILGRFATSVSNFFTGKTPNTGGAKSRKTAKSRKSKK